VLDADWYMLKTQLKQPYMEEQKLRVQRLRESLIAGENSGQLQSFDREVFKREMSKHAFAICIKSLAGAGHDTSNPFQQA